MLDKEKIAELTTRIVEKASSNEHLNWTVDAICVLYAQVYDTIKKKDQEN